MMCCREVIDLLCELVDGELTAELRHEVEAHLCECQNCVIYVETYRLTIRLSRRLEDKPLPTSLADKLLALCEEKRQQP